MLDNFHATIPSYLGLIQQEVDQLMPVLDAERYITQELETCDQDVLEATREELEAQR